MEKRIHIEYSDEEFLVTEEQLKQIQKERENGIKYLISIGLSKEEAERPYRLVIMKGDE